LSVSLPAPPPSVSFSEKPVKVSAPVLPTKMIALAASTLFRTDVLPVIMLYTRLWTGFPAPYWST
jgi:hypothetical protein